MRDLEINGLTGEEETRRQYEYIEKARQYVAQKEKEVGRKLTCCVHTFDLLHYRRLLHHTATECYHHMRIFLFKV